MGSRPPFACKTQAGNAKTIRQNEGLSSVLCFVHAFTLFVYHQMVPEELDWSTS